MEKKNSSNLQDSNLDEGGENSQGEDDKSFSDENSTLEKDQIDKDDKIMTTEEHQNSNVDGSESINKKFNIKKHSLGSGEDGKNLEPFSLKMDSALNFIDEVLNENVDQYDEFKKNTD